MSRSKALFASLAAAPLLVLSGARAQTREAAPQVFTPANARVCFTHLLAQANQVMPAPKTVTLPNHIVVDLPVPDKYSYADRAKGYWCSGSVAHSFTFGLTAGAEKPTDWPVLFLADIKPLPRVETLDTQMTFVDKHNRLINIVLQNNTYVEMFAVDQQRNSGVVNLPALMAALPADMPVVNEWRSLADTLRRYAAGTLPAPPGTKCAGNTVTARPPSPCQ